MRSRRLPSVLFLALFAFLAPVPAPIAVGAGGHDTPESGHKGAADEAASGGFFNTPREVDIPVMIVPVTAVDGRILSYAYLTLQVEVVGTDVWTVRAKIPFLQDAFLREMFARSIGLEAEPGQVDVEDMRERLKQRASAVLEKGTVTRIIVKQLNIGPA